MRQNGRAAGDNPGAPRRGVLFQVRRGECDAGAGLTTCHRLAEYLQSARAGVAITRKHFTHARCSSFGDEQTGAERIYEGRLKGRSPVSHRNACM